jgi:hypothetical protein
MPQISSLQMTEAKNWAGLTTQNHLGSIFGSNPQKASSMITRIHQVNHGMDLDTFLELNADKKYMDTDDDFVWDLMGSGKKNVPLVEARIGGQPVTGISQAGLNFTTFELVFPEQWFTDENIIVGHKNEKYPLQIKADPIPEGSNWVYTVELITGDDQLFVPFEELLPGKRFSKEWSLVEKTLSKKGGGINFTSPFKMRNSFTMIRMQHSAAGNMINRPIGCVIPVDTKSGKKTFKVWTQYEDFEFERQYRDERNRALMFSTANRREDGGYSNIGKSGHIKQQGAGLRQQMESSNTTFYNYFDIDMLLNVLVELSEGKLPQDKREFTLMTGERGAIQFHKAIEDYSQLFTPLRNTDRMYKTSGKNIHLGLGYGGQFIEYMGPQGIKVNIQVHSIYDDRERNKIYHPDGGVAESYRYDILDVGTTDGESNIQKVYVKDSEDILGYIPGFRNPFSPSGERNIMADPTDGYTIHRGSVFGVMVKDPSRTASLIPSVFE